MSKQTQNKWEEEFQMKYCGELYKQEVSEDFRGFRSCYQEVKDFISQEIEKAYQKGKEERERETVDERVWRCVRNETLEEVERILQKELETWAKESIGAKAVESIILAIKEYEQNK